MEFYYHSFVSIGANEISIRGDWEKRGIGFGLSSTLLFLLSPQLFSDWTFISFY